MIKKKQHPNTQPPEFPSRHACILLSCVLGVSLLDGATRRDLRVRGGASSCQRTVSSALTAAPFVTRKGDWMQLQEVRKKRGAGEDDVQSEGQLYAQHYTLSETRPCRSPCPAGPLDTVFLPSVICLGSCARRQGLDRAENAVGFSQKFKASLHEKQR